MIFALLRSRGAPQPFAVRAIGQQTVDGPHHGRGVVRPQQAALLIGADHVGTQLSLDRATALVIRKLEGT